MKQLFLKYRVHLLIIFGLLSLSLLLLSKKSPAAPKVLLVTPSDQSIGADLRTSIRYEFDQQVSLADISIASSPSINFQVTQPRPDTLLVDHTLAFQPSTTYTLTLMWQGQVIQTSSFTTMQSQEDPLLIQNMKDELARDYPLAQKLPYTTPQYRVVYSAPMTIEITLKSVDSDAQVAISEVRAWVTSQGGDVNAHKFVVVTP